MRSDIQRIESIQDKINKLRLKQNQIEQEITNNFAQVLKALDAFQIDFNSIVWGLLEVIETIRADPVKREAWKLIGESFCKKRINIHKKSFNKNEPEMEKQYV